MSNVTPITSQPTGSWKPERIGLMQTLGVESPLKPERIGQRLQKLPGWELTGEVERTAVWRGFRFHRTETAQAFARFAAEMARDHGQRPVISQSWNAVTVLLPGEGEVTETDLDFAESLMLLPQVGAASEGDPSGGNMSDADLEA